MNLKAYQSNKSTFAFVALVMTLAIWYTVDVSRPYGVTGANDVDQIAQIAIKRNDIAICDKMHLIGLSDADPSALRDVCYATYASAHPNERVCSRVDNDYRCIYSQASALNDASRCLPLRSGVDATYLEMCVAEIAYTTSKATLCSATLTDQTSRLKCQFLLSSFGPLQQH